MGGSFTSPKQHDFVVELDNEIYITGGTLSGHIRFPNKSTNMFNFVFWGEAVYTSEQSTVRDCDGCIYHTTTLLEKSLFTIEENDNSFSMEIPDDIPPSFTGLSHYPAVRYWMKCTATWPKDDTNISSQQTVSIFVIGKIDRTIVQSEGIHVFKEISNVCKTDIQFETALLIPGKRIRLYYKIWTNSDVDVLYSYVNLNRLVVVASQESITRVICCPVDFTDKSEDGNSKLYSGLVEIKTEDDKHMPCSFDGNVGINEFVNIRVSYELIFYIAIHSPEKGKQELCLCSELVVDSSNEF